MRLYSMGALLKVVFGCGILWTIYHYVQVYQQPIIALSLGFLGTFLLVRGVSYFFFLLCYRFFSHSGEQRQHSASYTHSLLLGVWVMVQLTLMMTNNRGLFAALASFTIFLLLHLSVAYGSGSKAAV